MIVLNGAGVVMGAAHRDDLAAAPAVATAAAVMRPGVSTVRPSEQAGDLVHRMRQAGVTRIAVIRSDGTQAGLFFAGDAPAG
ncbi:MAG TPA: CBS domain-containing protein [Streptosporangiaceae bacterium]|nr:CBS domain-containing protein [Streptosporangiaceae bacterium]